MYVLHSNTPFLLELFSGLYLKLLRGLIEYFCGNGKGCKTLFSCTEVCGGLKELSQWVVTIIVEQS